MIYIDYIDELNNTGSISVDKYPDVCPLCDKGVELRPFRAYLKKDNYAGYSTRLQVVFRCPRQDCQFLFFAFYNNPYHRSPSNLFFSKFGFFQSTTPKVFPEPIPTISPRFLDVFGQAQIADENNLHEIRGLAYGKALEILIKDYLIFTDPSKAEEIKNELHLSSLIDLIDDTDIQTVMDRAAWLRNDETHYERVFKDQDVEDLKTLIELTVQHLRRYELTKKYKEEMTSKKKPVKVESSTGYQKKEV